MATQSSDTMLLLRKDKRTPVARNFERTQIPLSRIATLVDIFLGGCAAASTGSSSLFDAFEMCHVMRNWVANNTWIIDGELELAAECVDLLNKSTASAANIHLATPLDAFVDSGSKFLMLWLSTVMFCTDLLLSHVTLWRGMGHATDTPHPSPWFESLHVALLIPILFFPFATGMNILESDEDRLGGWILLTTVEACGHLVLALMWRTLSRDSKRSVRVHRTMYPSIALLAPSPITYIINKQAKNKRTHNKETNKQTKNRADINLHRHVQNAMHNANTLVIATLQPKNRGLPKISCVPTSGQAML